MLVTSRALLLMLLLVLATSVLGTAQAQVVTAGPDSTQVDAPAVPDSLRKTARLLGMKVTPPTKAVLLAAFIPGAGQVYNHKYWKLPLVYGAVGGTLGVEFFYQSRYKEYVTGFRARQQGLPDPGPRSSQETSAENVRAGIIFYRRYRDQFIAYSLLAYGMTIVDALVDAHLRDFDVSDDLSVHWNPTLLRVPTAPSAPGVAITLNLKSTRSTK
ncbi:DUF5683 domain-containing protein [Hymenobacter jejuensis]|uniref:DUF5683 domain-containing protein n=1 Tax=Hymenobacter jejuensis TaxID=2502781 RepID=A0A5B8A1Z7_9BACT|nr:DUF5683 domain-containing protein [Hymenobacter jejuensis]QDA61167.1 hypothetical protein FHG12_14120 [Hymenobacter jejuensis]